MNILVIGNGFDLAHGLPTKYEHFLEYVEAYECFNGHNQEVQEEAKSVRHDFAVHFEFLLDNKPEIFSEFGTLISDNVWIQHFRKIRKDKILARKDSWIDFESEISAIIQTLDKARFTILEDIEKGNKHGNMTQQQWRILSPFWGRAGTSHKSIEFDETAVGHKKKRLLSDLNRLTRGLEIYLGNYVEEIILPVRLPDIDEIDVHCVLSFNYTHTYKRLYHQQKSTKIEYDYIHGEVKFESNVESCNLILGIDEYLDQYARNADNAFIEFKKFYQRIYKRTGSKYVDWIRNAERLPTAYKNSREHYSNNVYIFGHSLDITDKDILSRLINMEGTRTTVFYYNQEALGNQISNLVKVLGEDELISKVHGANASVVFQQQKNSIPIKS